MAVFTSRRSRPRTPPQCCFVEALEVRRLLAFVTLNPSTAYQTIQGWGTAAVYPTNLVTVAQAGAIMRDAGMNMVRITAAPDDYTYTVGGNMRTPVPISANLDENVARFYPGGTEQTALIDWLQANAFEPDRIKMIGALWSPPHWMKITTGRLMNWDDNGTPRSEYDPIIPWGDYGHNTGGGHVNPTMWTDWARYVLSAVKVFEQRAGLPMHAFSFQNEPNVPAVYNSNTFPYIANDVNNPSAGFTDNHWELYGDGLQALANERALHPEISTKFFGPELSQLGGGAGNPYYLPAYNSVRQNLISRGLLDDLGGWATHQYVYPADDAAMWDAWYSGSAHAAQIINGTNNLGWLGPTPGIAPDNKEIWQTETDGENQTWTKDGAMGFGLKIHNALVLGNVSGYTSWTLTGYSSSDSWGVVDLDDINNPTNSFKYNAFKHFSRWIRPGAQRINATFANGKASTGGAHELDTYNGLNVAAFKHTQDQRLTMVFTNMRNAAESTTITIPPGMNISSFQLYQTTASQKYVQLADLVPSGGQVTLTVPASGFVTITASYAVPTLPAPWTANDIGSPSPIGSSFFDSGTNTFTVSGGGADIWNTSDQFQFMSQDFTGNGSIIARVTSVQNTNTWAKAGVMFRDSTAADAMFADVVVTPSSGVSFQWRNSTGGNGGYVQVGGVTAPKWVKLTRSGNSFTAYYATTTATPAALDWIQIGTAQTIAMNNASKVGLAVTSHNNGTLCTATFTGVQVSQANGAPTVATPAAATPRPVTGTSSTLSGLGADDGGEPALIYTWATSGMPPAPVSFSLNGSNAAKSTIATFSKAGNYGFLLTITDAGGLSITSSVAVTVNQIPTTVTVTPAGLTLAGGSTQQYLASALDQFGQAISSPTFSWGATGGMVSSSGLYTAGQTGGNFSVTATADSAIGSASVSVVPIAYGGDSGADEYYLRRSGSTLNIWLGDGTGSPTYAIAFSSVPSLAFNGNGGADRLTLEGTDIYPAGGITFSGGDGDDTLVLKNTATGPVSFLDSSGNQAITINGGSFTFVTDIAAGTANVTLGVINAIVTLDAPQRLAAVTASGTGKIDLKDKSLILTNQLLEDVTSQIATAINGGDWSGNGITTSMSEATGGSGYTTLGAARASDVKGIGPAETALWRGQTVAGTDLLVMYTYGGDATLDGKVNVDDYGQIDFNIGQSAPVLEWYHGDFNYDSKINIDDYGIIDFVVSTQGPPMMAGDGLGLPVTAESASLSIIALAAAAAGSAQKTNLDDVPTTSSDPSDILLETGDRQGRAREESAYVVGPIRRGWSRNGL